MRLFIIRHADPDYENNTITKAGHLEARALAERFKKHGFDKIFTSPMGRAIDTMKYTAEALNMGFEIADWTKELWPEMVIENDEGQKMMSIDIPGELLRAEQRNLDQDAWFEYKNIKESEVLESYKKLEQDSDAFIRKLGYERVDGRYRIIKPSQDKVAVFCHAGFGLTWIAHLLAIPPTLIWSGFWVAPSSVTTILFEERSSEWAVPRCISLGDISHLYSTGIKESTMGIKANYY
ncbi:MAG: histidine phosphatase family protein [Bacillota bacterium]